MKYNSTTLLWIYIFNLLHVLKVSRSKETLLYGLTKDELHTSTSVPCNLFSALSRGKHQSVISYTLYGTNTIYYEKLKDLSRQISEMYPGWLMRVYHDRYVYLFKCITFYSKTVKDPLL